MPTTKRRISVVPDEKLYEELEALARRRKIALSAVSLDLIRRAIELEEDFHLSQMADARLAKRERRVPHRRAWT